MHRKLPFSPHLPSALPAHATGKSLWLERTSVLARAHLRAHVRTRGSIHAPCNMQRMKELHDATTLVCLDGQHRGRHARRPSIVVALRMPAWSPCRHDHLGAVHAWVVRHAHSRHAQSVTQSVWMVRHAGAVHAWMFHCCAPSCMPASMLTSATATTIHCCCCDGQWMVAVVHAIVHARRTRGRHACLPRCCMPASMLTSAAAS